jgi:hypothetical protein
MRGHSASLKLAHCDAVEWGLFTASEADVSGLVRRRQELNRGMYINPLTWAKKCSRALLPANRVLV